MPSNPKGDELLCREIRAIVDIDPTAEIEAFVGYGAFATRQGPPNPPARDAIV
jgi:hypothetical protein